MDSDSRLLTYTAEDGDSLARADGVGGIASVLSVIYFLRLYKMFYLFSLLPLFPAKQIACASAKRAATRPQIHVKVRKKDIRCTSLYTHTITHICIPIYILYLYSALPRALRPNEPMNYFLPSSKFQGSSSSSTETDVALALRKLRKRKVFNICNATTITNEKVTVKSAWM